MARMMRRRPYGRKYRPRSSMRSRMGRRKTFRKGYSRTGGLYKLSGRGGAELKFYDASGANVNPGAEGGCANSLNLIPQGTGAAERIGRKVTVKSLSITVTILGSTDAGVDNLYRFIFFVDRQCNGEPATVPQVLQGTPANPAFLAHPNVANSQRFAILADKYFRIPISAPKQSIQDLNDSSPTYGRTTTQLYIRPSITFRFTKRMNLPLEFSDGAVSMASIRSNNISFLAVAVSGGAEDTNFTYISRIRYLDK